MLYFSLEKGCSAINRCFHQSIWLFLDFSTSFHQNVNLPSELLLPKHSIICICLDMFSSSCCLFSVAIFSSSCHPIKCPSPTSKMVAMSVPSIRMHINMSSTPVPLTLICFPLPYVVILFFYHHIPNPSLPHSNSFSSLLFFLLSSIIPPSHYTYTSCCHGRSLSERLDLRVVSNMKLNVKLNTYVMCMIHHVLTRCGLRKVEQTRS